MTAPSDKPAIHASMMSKLSLCGVEFEREYMLGIKSRKSVPLILGTAVDAAVALDATHKMEHDVPATRAEVREKAASMLDTTWDGEEPMLSDEERATGSKIVRAESKDMAAALAGLYNAQVTPGLKPIGVQVKRRLTLNGFPFDLEGTSDVEETSVIRDSKTSGKTPSADMADGHVQLQLYGFIREKHENRPIERLKLDFLVKTKVPKYVLVQAPAPASWDSLLRRIERFANVVQKGAFYPVDPSGPSAWKCTAKFCSHFADCEFGARRKSTFISAEVIQ